jgi:hypothetical protein
MATYSLVHGAWHGGWAWDLVRAELEERGHVVHTPDLPIEDVDACVEDYATVYATVVPAADVVVGHSLGGLVIPHVDAGMHVFLCALIGGVSTKDAFVPGFGDARIRDGLGRSYYPDPADGARELQYPPELVSLAEKLRRQSPVVGTDAQPDRSAYIVCTRDASIRPQWQRSVAVNPVELDAGHSPMLECPAALADLLAP